MILELSDQDNVALEEISKILERHPDLKLIEMVVEPTLIFNHLIIDTGKRKVYYNQQEVLLTTKEYELPKNHQHKPVHSLLSLPIPIRNRTTRLIYHDISLAIHLGGEEKLLGAFPLCQEDNQ